MPDPISLTALGVAVAKLLLRWGDLNSTADALEDAQAGFNALRALRSSRAIDPIGAAIAARLQGQLRATLDSDRREQLQIAALNVTDLFSELAADDAAILKAANDPSGFPAYLSGGRGAFLLANTAQDITPFTEQLMNAAADTFAQLAPLSGHFAPAALLHLIDQAGDTASEISTLRETLDKAHDELSAAMGRLEERVNRLHPVVDEIMGRLRHFRVTGDSVSASAAATTSGAVMGCRIGDWNPAHLGIHESIRVPGAAFSEMTPYVSRRHDGVLRERLVELTKPRARSAFVIVVGASCVGKSRAFYEAVRKVLPDWHLIATATASELQRILFDGVPKQTVIWLDELQDRLPLTDDAYAAAEGLRDLLLTTDERAKPILVAASIWESNLIQLQNPSMTRRAQGGGAIPALLAHSTRVLVEEVFNQQELSTARASPDVRLRDAARTAAESYLPRQGWKVTQVLAGGTGIIDRLYPEGRLPDRPFSPAARAIILAAADLRRVGLPNPIPRWALQGAAPGYLDTPQPRPPRTWLDQAIDEATRDANNDDPILNQRSHDIQRHGTPALTPTWVRNDLSRDDLPSEGYLLHDYVLQEHLRRHSHHATRPALWQTLIDHAPVLSLGTVYGIAQAAEGRGLFTIAQELLNTQAASGSTRALDRLADLLAQRRDPAALRELRRMSDSGNRHARNRLADTLDLAIPDDLAEIRQLAESGNRQAAHRLIAWLGRRDDPQSLAELRQWAQRGSRTAKRALVATRARQGDLAVLSELRNEAQVDRESRILFVAILARRGDEEAIAELRQLAKTFASARDGVAYLLSRRGDATSIQELRGLAEAGDEAAFRRLVQWLSARAGDMDAYRELRQLAATGNAYAIVRLAAINARNGDSASLAALEAVSGAEATRARDRLVIELARRADFKSLERLREEAEIGHRLAARRITAILRDRGDSEAIETLQELTHACVPGAAEALMVLYRRRDPAAAIDELDLDANPKSNADGSAGPRSTSPGR